LSGPREAVTLIQRAAQMAISGRAKRVVIGRVIGASFALSMTQGRPGIADFDKPPEKRLNEPAAAGVVSVLAGMAS